jgi:hypothetical protein
MNIMMIMSGIDPQTRSSPSLPNRSTGNPDPGMLSREI